jgi:hypothetical protein
VDYFKIKLCLILGTNSYKPILLYGDIAPAPFPKLPGTRAQFRESFVEQRSAADYVRDIAGFKCYMQTFATVLIKPTPRLGFCV